jgi:trigger factor
MTVTVETLEKLERRITLTLAAAEIGKEVDTRLKRLSRTVKVDGFRPGKVPMSVVAQRYAYSVQYEVMNDRVSQAFTDAATQAQLRVAGAPRISQREQAPEGQLAFDATFEVIRASIEADPRKEFSSSDLGACYDDVRFRVERMGVFMENAWQTE